MPRGIFPIAILALLATGPKGQAQPAAAPTEHVTVTAPKDAPDAVVNHFVQSFTTPSYLTGKVARWESGICPVTVGLAPKFTAFITARVRAVAARTGAPVDKNPACRPNIEIAFTTTPQGLMDEIRKRHRNYLGYAEGAGQADRLAVVTHPIQAWYMTATKDLDGNVEVDAFNQVPVPIQSPCDVCAGGYMEVYVPGAKKITGGRIKDGLRTVFHHIIIAANTGKLADYEMGALADYVAMLALTQLQSLDVCQPLPSIINLLGPHCEGAPGQISDSDLGSLSGLYAMSADGNLRMQQDGIAYRMKEGLGPGK
jgi:hypothetical protein